MNTIPIEALKHIETAMKEVCSNDEARKNLQFVYLTFDGKKVKVQASNGYIMTERFFNCETDFTGEYQISKDLLKVVSLLIKEKGHHYLMVKDGDNIKICLYNRPVEVFLTPSKDNKPCFDKVMKDHKNIKYSIRCGNENETFIDVEFNPELLLKVFKAMKIHRNEKGIRVRISLTNKNGIISQRPVAMVIDRGHDTALLMPMM
jgi:hypothetical protein